MLFSLQGLKTGMYYLRTRAAVDAIKFTVDTSALNHVMEFLFVVLMLVHTFHKSSINVCFIVFEGIRNPF